MSEQHRSGVRLWVSSSAVAAVAGGLGSLGAQAWTSDAVDRRVGELIEARLGAERKGLLAEVSAAYAGKEVTEYRIAASNEVVRQQLEAIRQELAVLREQTRDVPRLAAFVDSMRDGAARR